MVTLDLQGSALPGIAASQPGPASLAPGRSRYAPKAAPPASRSLRSAGHAIHPRSAPQQPLTHRHPHQQAPLRALALHHQVQSQGCLGTP